jgi:hypothetical protein
MTSELAQAMTTARTGIKGWTNPDTGEVTADVKPGMDAYTQALSTSQNPDVRALAAVLLPQQMAIKDERDYRAGERKEDREFQRGLQADSFTHSERLQKEQLEHAATQGALTREQQTKLAELQIKATQAEGAATRGQQTALATQQQNFTREENITNRAHQLQMEDKKLSVEEARARAQQEFQAKEKALDRETTIQAAKLRAGADDPMSGVTPGFNPELAGKLGVPQADTDPYRGLDRKNAQALYKSNHQRVEKELDKGEEEMIAAKNRQADAKRFLALNEETGTGGIYKVPGSQSVAGLFSNNMQEMSAITDRLTPKMREPGAGATSDFDANLMRNALFGPTKDREVNKNVATAMIQKDQNVIDYQQFKRDYFDANGHIGGAERAWRQYLNANPIFDPKAKEGSYALNPNRVSYREFFGGKQTPAQDAAPAAAPAASAAANVPAPPPGFVVQ